MFVHVFYPRLEGKAISFTYNLVPPFDDVARVRFAIGDIDSAAAIFQDEAINFRISESGGWKGAVIDCIQSIIAQLSTTPDFSADWLRVSQATALKYWQSLLTIKRQEYGIALIQAQAVFLYRPDATRQTQAPTFTDADDVNNDNDD